MLKKISTGLNNTLLRLFIIAAIILPFQFSSCSSPDPTTDPVVKVSVADRMGTGVIINKNGYVLTSEHFVHGQQKADVTLKSGKTYEGAVVCNNPNNDIAIIKLSGDFSTVPYAEMRDSDLVKEMEDVLVSVSSANAEAAAVFQGKLLAIRKNKDTTYLQTNAYGSPDGAGSPLFNKAGEMIGMVIWNPNNAEGTILAIATNDIIPFITEVMCSGCAGIAIEKTGIESVFSSSAAISWSTNKRAVSWIEYGTTESYGSSTDIGTDLVIEDAAVIQNLTPNTTYHFRIRAIDICGHEAFSADNTLTTTRDTSLGEALAILSINLVDVKSTSTTIVWVTNKPSSSEISYGTSETNMPGKQSSKGLVYEHRVELSGLSPETRYYVDVQSVSASGESATGAAAPFKTQSTTKACCRSNCKMPDFVLQSIDGTDFTLDNIAGHRAILLFAKSTCSTCMAQALYLNDIYAEMPNSDIKFCVVFNNEKKEDVLKWKTKYGIQVPIYLDLKGDLVNYCMFRTIPTTLIIDSKGQIIHAQEGAYGSKRALEEQIKDF